VAPSGPDRPCILHPHPMCHLPQCGNLPSSSIHIAYTNPSLAAISQSPTITCSPIAIPSLSIHTAIALPTASCPPPATGSLPTRHTRPTPHSRPRPFAMPCNPRARFSLKPHFVRCHAHCCTFLVLQNPSHRIEIVRSHSHQPQSPPANLRTHLSLSHNTRTHPRTHTRRCQPTPPKPPRNLPILCDAIPPSCSLQRLPTDLNNLSDPAFATRRPIYPFTAHTTSTRIQIPILPTS
jgi:hypothetical protein